MNTKLSDFGFKQKQYVGVRKVVLCFLLFVFSAGHSFAAELKLSVLPGYAWQSQSMGVFRSDLTFLFGDGVFLLGPYVGYEALAPQATDTTYGAAIRIGKESYFQIQGGYYRRVFTQPGTSTLTGNGYAVGLIYGNHLNSFLGIDIVLSGKRISSGTLDRRWIVDLLPTITFRGEF